MNLHNIVRPAINTINPETLGTWQKSTGATTGANFKRTPSFTTFTDIPMQVQAMSGGDLWHTEYLNIEGVKRAVYLYGNVQGVVRVDARGGDLLQFPEVLGGPVYEWLVYSVLESWTTSIDGGGWCKVAVVLQDTAPS